MEKLIVRMEQMKMMKYVVYVQEILDFHLIALNLQLSLVGTDIRNDGFALFLVMGSMTFAKTQRTRIVQFPHGNLH